MEPKHKTMKEYGPSPAAFIHKIEHYRANPRANTLNPKAAQINC